MSLLQIDWDPDHRATGQPHPKELPGRDIGKNSQGYWEVYVLLQPSINFISVLL